MSRAARTVTDLDMYRRVVLGHWECGKAMPAMDGCVVGGSLVLGAKKRKGISWLPFMMSRKFGDRRSLRFICLIYVST